MIFAEDFQPNHQRFLVILQRLSVVALLAIHFTDIVVTCGGIGMIFAGNF